MRGAVQSAFWPRSRRRRHSGPTRTPPGVRALVAEEDDPVAEGARLNEPEVDLGVRWLEHGFAPADDDGMDIEPVSAIRSWRMKAAARSDPPRARSPPGWALTSHHLLDDEVSDHGGVPVGLVQGPREHNLGHVPPDAGGLDHGPGTRRVRVGRRPELGHQLVGDPTVDEGAHGAELVVEVAVQLVVDRVPTDLPVRSMMKPSSDTDVLQTIFLIADRSTEPGRYRQD